MRVLAIETATVACAIALSSASGGEVRVLDEHRRHTEVLATGIAALLADHAIGPRDLERVVVDRGPGLFTGLRVGVATALALAGALGIDLVGVTSLELYAHGARAAGVRGRLVAAVDARRGEVFVQTFGLDDGVVELSGPAVATPRDVVIAWATSGAPVTFTGDGVRRYRADFAAVPNGDVLDATVPPPGVALALAPERDPAGAVTPLYLRDADAVANFSTRDAHP